MARALGELGRAADQVRGELDRLRHQVSLDAVEIESLQRALFTARTIGMAMGVIMEREKVTAEEAFARLSTLSQHANVKARVLAERIARTGAY